MKFQELQTGDCFVIVKYRNLQASLSPDFKYRKGILGKQHESQLLGFNAENYYGAFCYVNPLEEVEKIMD